MTIKEVIEILNNPNMLNRQCNFKLTGKGHSKFDIILDKLEQIENRIDKLEKRIDNLVKVNNLKE